MVIYNCYLKLLLASESSPLLTATSLPLQLLLVVDVVPSLGTKHVLVSLVSICNTRGTSNYGARRALHDFLRKDAFTILIAASLRFTP